MVLLAVGVQDKHGDFAGCVALVRVKLGICFDQFGPETPVLFSISLFRLDRDTPIHQLDGSFRMPVEVGCEA
jgi:hypothetical protein